ncbi:hypothetical protein F5148DRAFT_933293 [Russula earlei]|uniref:Uncharacterized protein n=1 Tax=Russula earlei TaxID=71964 RepID=A0ACC0U9W9_9AGAM|nr:hypothetical protein F5148DRAFT_933293 [Russula earlei]
MRASTVFAVVCLAIGVAPSFASSSKSTKNDHIPTLISRSGGGGGGGRRQLGETIFPAYMESEISPKRIGGSNPLAPQEDFASLAPKEDFVSLAPQGGNQHGHGHGKLEATIYHEKPRLRRSKSH